MSRQNQVTFTRLRAVDRNIVYLGTNPDGQELGTRFTAICQYYSGSWSYETLPLALADMVLFKESESSRRVLFVLSEDGTVVNFHTKGAEATLPATSPLRAGHRLGYLIKMASIGDCLYACGDGGQVYKRDGSIWSNVDPSLLDGPDDVGVMGTALSDAYHKVFFNREAKQEDIETYNKLLRDNQSKTIWWIDGSSKDDIYTCCEKSTVYHYDGSSFRAVPTQADQGLLSILIESPDRVWVSGRHGTLLRGNSVDGFRPVPGMVGRPQLNGMAWFDGRLYLSSYSSPRGLFVYEGGRLRRVLSGLTPDIEDVSMIEAVDGVLWVMGGKDLLRFDGQRWERIDFPANDPLR